MLDAIADVSEEFFHTATDPTQMPMTVGSLLRLRSLHRKTLLYRTENGRPISWTAVIPTSDDLAERFLSGEIDERALFERSVPMPAYEALYLCIVFTLPEYRRKGYVIDMLQEAIRDIPHVPGATLFAWAYTEEGGMVMRKLGRILGTEIRMRESGPS